jgi:hypothetical protein
MVQADLNAFMRCDENGCDEKQRVQLMLTASGGFAFRPTEKEKWHITANTSGVWLAKCPKHAPIVEPTPIIEGVR